jgi:hypothetical protein
MAEDGIWSCDSDGNMLMDSAGNWFDQCGTCWNGACDGTTSYTLIFSSLTWNGLYLQSLAFDPSLIGDEVVTDLGPARAPTIVVPLSFGCLYDYPVPGTNSLVFADSSSPTGFTCLRFGSLGVNIWITPTSIPSNPACDAWLVQLVSKAVTSYAEWSNYTVTVANASATYPQDVSQGFAPSGAPASVTVA